MRERHWARISELVGAEIVRTAESTLADMVEQGVHVFGAQLADIEQHAAKEHALERALAKMKDEWLAVKFDVVPYRSVSLQPVAVHYTYIILHRHTYIRRMCVCVFQFS